MDTYRAVVDKRDQRAYLGRPIPDEALRRILQAGRMTGSSAHAFDAGRCAQNLMLAAWNDGIGSCPAHLPEAEVATLLGIPSDLSVNRVIGFGYVDPERARPRPSVARQRRPLTEPVHWDRW
ncbi:MAG TPA: nitroreductase family protein [Methylomirabilota bacterium]|jgi:nitroreductase